LFSSSHYTLLHTERGQGKREKEKKGRGGKRKGEGREEVEEERDGGRERERETETFFLAYLSLFFPYHPQLAHLVASEITSA
jgi:hypothetical protein